jgi:poly-beta-1,6-N-acetyl-D-glucosamine synthase
LIRRTQRMYISLSLVLMFPYFSEETMESILFYIILLFLTGYAYIHFMIFRGLKKLSQPLIGYTPTFSIIVAARNEEHTIQNCLESLVHQNYPKQNFEIIVANDRSTDSTKQIIEEYCRQYSNVHIVDIEILSLEMPAKKNALLNAIAQSHYDIFAFTDADCIVGNNWLIELSKNFTPDVGFVAGYSPYDLSTIQNYFGRTFLRYEEYKNTIGAAAGIGLNNGFMCTGRNIAYRRSVFEQVRGFEKIKYSISGDDDLFIQLVQRETRWNMRYMTSLDSNVKTKPPISVKQFINQRTRHFSTGSYYPYKMKLIYGILHSFNVLVLLSLFFIPFNGLIIFVIKLNIDAIILTYSQNIFMEKFSLFEFITGELLYVCQNTLIGPLGYFAKFSWKDNSAR